MVAVPDLHYPLHDVSAVNCVKKIISRVKPDEIIYMGDVGEWESVNHYISAKKKRPPLEHWLPLIDAEIDGVNDFLSSFPTAKKVTVIQGNHDLWLDDFVEAQGHPIFNKYRFKDAIKITQRGWHYEPYGDLYRVGKILFYHGGHYTTMYHCKKHLIEIQDNVLYAHMHDIQRHSQTTANGYIAAFSIGCLKRIDRKSNLWLKGKKTNWGHACAVIDFDSRGFFRCDIVDIINGKTWLWGKEVKG